MQYPKELKYTKEHEWAKINEKNVTIGITDHAQNALGDIVFVELPPIGKVLKQGEAFGVVESIKAVSDLYSPVTGKVTKVNETVIKEPSQLNKDPHKSAWLIEIEATDTQTFQNLLNSDDYTHYVEKLK
ncbi:MAG: glycine cleavage system protein GcvH [Deltaproteobacteria bacterium]|nr:glycine cleavage system protein GcvH [Deltaproteobacteria bacterium]